MFALRADAIYFDETRLGPRGALLADRGELRDLTTRDGVIHVSMPKRIDYAFAIGTRIMVAESKRPADLITSTQGRRLARQLRDMRSVIDDTGLIGIVLRGGIPSFNDPDIDDVITNLVRLQVLGVTLLPVPAGDRQLVKRLAVYRELLVPGTRTPFKAIAGTDKAHTLTRVKGLGIKSVATLIEIAVGCVSEEELGTRLRNKKLAKRLKEGT